MTSFPKKYQNNYWVNRERSETMRWECTFPHVQARRHVKSAIRFQIVQMFTNDLNVDGFDWRIVDKYFPKLKKYGYKLILIVWVDGKWMKRFKDAWEGLGGWGETLRQRIQHNVFQLPKKDEKRQMIHRLNLWGREKSMYRSMIKSRGRKFVDDWGRGRQ